jgi:hypothetical protein
MGKSEEESEELHFAATVSDQAEKFEDKTRLLGLEVM